jgi:transmembrane sensor
MQLNYSRVVGTHTSNYKNMESTISKYTLFEYLAGRANPLERKFIEEWLQNPANHECFYQWLMEWESRSPQFLPEHETALKSLLERLETDQYTGEGDIEKKEAATVSGFRKLWLIAATIIAAAGCGWWFRESVQYKTYTTSYGETTEIYLSDSSRVSLNANSTLRVPRFGFLEGNREVFLLGEAAFSVRHTSDHKRFIVKTSKTFQVEVLGTEFSVFSRPRGTKVALKSGSVKIDYEQGNINKEMIMEPGDLATLDTAGAVQLERKQNTENIAAWKEQRYVFNNTSLREVCVMIEENFGEKVTLSSNEIAGRTITGNFKTKNADDLLKAISEAMDLKIIGTSDSILITTY